MPDSLLVLLTVLAADATCRAIATGRLRTLLLAGLWVLRARPARPGRPGAGAPLPLPPQHRRELSHR